MTDRDLQVPGGPSIPATELVETASRSGGPGGQHVNKSSTRVTLRWCIPASRALDAEVRARLLARLGTRLTRRGELIVHADRERSRARNLEAARRRLAELVGTALREPEMRRPTRPSRGSRQRRLDAKRHRASVKRARASVGRHGLDEG